METNTKMIGLHPTLPMVTLNVDDLNTPVKKQRLPDWVNRRPKCKIPQVKYDRLKKSKYNKTIEPDGSYL